MKKILALTMIFIVGLACGLIFAYGPLHAQSSSGEGDVMEKLNDISKKQDDVIAAVNSMQEDVRIIKIRITQNQ